MAIPRDDTMVKKGSMQQLYQALISTPVPTVHVHAGADPGFHEGGSVINNAREIFKATPTRALTTPIFDRARRVLGCLAGSRPEFAQKHS